MTNSIKSYRYHFVNDEDRSFVAYQRRSSAGGWQTVSLWMIPKAVF